MEIFIMETYRDSGIWQFKVVEEINNDVSFELVDDVDYEGNAEVIESPVRESPVRPRRSGRERQAIRRSLDYHKEMRKGR
jgi:hypothetical protein